VDDLSRKIINSIQLEFPIDREPFSILGKKLGVTSDDIIDRIKGLKKTGVLNQIGPVINARRLGYRITLVAANIDEANVDDAGRIMAEHPGVGHCYKREHVFNLWLTLSLPPGSSIVDELMNIKDLTGAEAVFHSPAVRTFKIGAYFDATGEGCLEPADSSDIKNGNGSDFLSEIDKKVLNGLQAVFPLTNRPFDVYAQSLNMDTDDLLERCISLKQRGIIRRYSALIRHHLIGYVANAMVCWNVSPDLVSSVGERLSAEPLVSHCYERKINQYWRYNMFCMMHAYSRDTCYGIVERLAKNCNIEDYVILFSTKEYKKSRVFYSV